MRPLVQIPTVPIGALVFFAFAVTPFLHTSAIAGPVTATNAVGQGSNSSTGRSHWAFQPIKTVLPPSSPRGWSEHPVDRFIFAQLRSKGLKPGAPAGKRTLLRRVYFDLVGLAPSPEEVRAFETDNSPHAWNDVVERLLASPRYGERWGRHWMDVVRYADTAGDNADYPVPEARRYRDYIIDAFNADKPYDEFVREQIAGDILAARGPRERYAGQLVATGFLAISRRYATAPFEFMHLTIEDAIETTGRTFMGLTLRCARCHDHKFDPVTKEDYYALYGFFESTAFPYAGSEEFESKKMPRRGFVPLVPREEVAAQIRVYEEKVAALDAEVKQLEKDLEAAKGDPELKPALEQKLKPLRADLARLKRPGAPSALPVAYAVSDGKPVDAHLQPRGEPDEAGPIVPRHPPRFLTGNEPFHVPAGVSGRLQFAEWLTQTEHPLTARVMVNRIWQHHFGRGLVATPSNFGLRGEPPTHADLLDYLAVRFREGGWSIKNIHRLILSSKTWQLASLPDSPASKGLEVDPDNKFYWRHDRRRLDAEAIRDTMLLLAGNLDLNRPGPHPFPPIEEWHWTQHNPFKTVYESNHRSVYLMTQRIQRHPYLALFDGPDANTSTDVRTDSTVPLQALYLMNNPFVREQAAALARHLMQIEPDEPARVRAACELVWTRPPSAAESKRAREYIARYRDELARTGVAGHSQETEAWASYARILLTANEFFYVD